MSTENMETEELPEAEPVVAAVVEEADAASDVARSKKRPRSPSEPMETTASTAAAMASVSAASAAAAAQLSATMGWNGLYSLLSASALASAANLPTVDQVQQAAQKCVADCPPFVHLSKTDTAPQLKVMDDCRHQLKGGMRGYRMSRATHGISQGHYYYEVLILEPPKLSDIVASFPSNVRMGPKLQEQMKLALQAEKEGKPVDPSAAGFGPHVRLGFSNRTGDLQAPVGYDKWSYAIRDMGGSKIHCSRREDDWGGESFGPGDVIGCAISILPRKETVLAAPVAATATVPETVVPDLTTNTGTVVTAGNNNSGNSSLSPSTLQNQIRFFKNGLPMGQVVNAKGKKESSAAFFVPDGVYYPAISLYMGACVRVNFGPHFICPPRKSASTVSGLAKYKPVSDLCDPPISVQDAITKVQKEKVVRKADMMQKFQELVATEVQVLQDSYRLYRQKHLQLVKQQRVKRGAKMDDLEEDEFHKEEEEVKG